MHTVSTVNSHSAQMSDALVIKMVIVYFFEDSAHQLPCQFILLHCVIIVEAV